MREDISALENELQEILIKIPQWEREQREKIRTLNREITSHAIGHLIAELKKKYSDLPKVLEFIEKVRENLMENSDEFQASDTQSPQDMFAAAMSVRPREDSFRRFRVNVIVDNSKTKGAPVIYEDLPTHANVIGRTEQMVQFGALTTDFNLIKSGALHNANGGYLIIDARKLLIQPVIWEEVKRALFSNEIRIQDLTEALGFTNTVTLRPQPIPLNAKIVLLGDSMIYYLLSQADPDFRELFKVVADFDDQVVRNSGNTALYGQLISEIAERETIRSLNKGAIGRIIEHATRLAADSERLTLRMRPISDLLFEADYRAEQNRHSKITTADIQETIDAQNHRADRIRERSHEQILRDTLLIDTEGEAVGQINGLSVLQLGDFAFGKPTRITAQVRMGRGEVIDIEREVDLGGSLHSKGILILSGYLGAKFAKASPLALSASLVFEQSYGGVDGDSASSAELYALLSALSDTPIKQSLAVTGSVNQFGQVQAIGGANEKIEGFFDICNARGLTGSQGVLIPSSNVKHLMLRQDVINAVKNGKFHIYPVDHIDQGIELLTSVAAGKENTKGNYPLDSVNGTVRATLASFAESALKFRASADQKSEHTV